MTRGKKIILTIAILGAVVIFVPLIMGSMAPVYHEASGSIEINKPIDKAWPILNNPALMEKISPAVKKIEMLPAKKPGFHIWKEYFDEENYIQFEYIELEPKKRWVVEIAETVLPVSGRWIFEVKDTSDGAFTLHITDKGEIHSALFRFISKYIRGYDFIINMTLNDLKKYIEKNA